MNETVLVFGNESLPFASLWGERGVRRMGENEFHVTLEDNGTKSPLILLAERDVGRALRKLAARSIDVVVVDGRVSSGASEADCTALLEALFPEHQVDGPGERSRTLLLVDETSVGARLAFLAGRRRIVDALVAPTDAAAVLRVRALCARRNQGKVAVCLAGGGIEGLLYEVGVLRAMDQFIEGRSVCDLDLFCGISAGAVLGSLLANGLSPEEIADGLRKGTPRLDRITRWDIFDPNIGEMGARLWQFAKDVLGRGGARNALSALYRAVPSAAFAGGHLRDYLQRQLTRPGMADQFEDLRRPLLVGATDQDTSEAVVFGENGWTDVPVHKAVRASCALVPFFAAEKIGSRYYIDGAFTRTTNMRVAVKHGGSLVLMVDPLVPIYSEVAGYVRRRGGIFATMQGLKSLINGRFDKAVASIREMYPEVRFHLFRPEGDEMRILSGSPMKFLYREEIEELAYQRTTKKIRAMMKDLQRDFARHGIVFRDPLSLKKSGASSAFQDGLVAA